MYNCLDELQPCTVFARVRIVYNFAVRASAFKDHKNDTFIGSYGEMLLNHSTLHRFVLFYLIHFAFHSTNVAYTVYITRALPLR